MSEKLYPAVDHMALAGLYTKHVLAMTDEGLHAKSDIAGQLAWRDQQIDTAQRRAERLEEALKDAVCALECCGKDYHYVLDKARAALQEPTA